MNKKAELKAKIEEAQQRAKLLKALMAENNKALWEAQAELTDIEYAEDALNDFNYVGSKHHY